MVGGELLIGQRETRNLRLICPKMSTTDSCTWSRSAAERSSLRRYLPPVGYICVLHLESVRFRSRNDIATDQDQVEFFSTSARNITDCSVESPQIVRGVVPIVVVWRGWLRNLQPFPIRIRGAVVRRSYDGGGGGVAAPFPFGTVT